jgi:hypothetical protein
VTRDYDVRNMHAGRRERVFPVSKRSGRTQRYVIYTYQPRDWSPKGYHRRWRYRVDGRTDAGGFGMIAGSALSGFASRREARRAALALVRRAAS